MTTKWALAPSVVRTARKDHRCVRRPEPCAFGGVIKRGQTYIEYLGEAAAFQSGHRYHVGCADLYDQRPTWHRSGVCLLPYPIQSLTPPTEGCCGGEPAPYEMVELG